MKTITSNTKSIENLLVEEKTGSEETSQSNFTAEDTQEFHMDSVNHESWEKIIQRIKENVYFR